MLRVRCIFLPLDEKKIRSVRSLFMRIRDAYRRVPETGITGIPIL